MKNNKEIYAYVNYKDSNTLYIYKCNNSFKKGDIVETPINYGALYTFAIIKKIVKLPENKLPIEKSKILTITKKLPYQEYEKFFYPIRFMKKNINKTLLKEWYFSSKNNWAVTYQSSFNGTISYEKDGVFICSLGSITNYNYFQEDLITNKKHLKTKIKYAQTLLSLLYYNKINKQHFCDLLKII